MMSFRSYTFRVLPRLGKGNETYFEKIKACKGDKHSLVVFYDDCKYFFFVFSAARGLKEKKNGGKNKVIGKRRNPKSSI